MADLRLENVRKSFGDVKIIHDIDLTIHKGEFIVFVGPSGCGKSTLLRMIAGLETVSGGSILIDGNDITRVEPSRRGIAMVFQSYALYPHMNVEDNIGFGLEMAGIPKKERQRMVRQVARTLQLDTCLNRKPRELSGGQRQRVAIGRAIVRNPKIFLFDEPLSNLDAELRLQMRLEIARLHTSIGTTMIYVTHDQIEAMTLADRIVVLRAGHMEQVGSPMKIYKDPDNLFVARFIGSPKMNFITAFVAGRMDDGRAVVSLPSWSLNQIKIKPRNPNFALPNRLLLGIRPEHFHPSAGGVERVGATGNELGGGQHVSVDREGETKGEDFRLDFYCDGVEQLGSVSYLHCRSEREGNLTVEWREPYLPLIGSQISFFVNPADCLLFDPAGSRL